MIELRQNKIWSDSLNSTLEFDQPWNCVDRGLHKFICFGEGGDSGGAGGDGGGFGGVEAYGPQAAEVAAELGEMGFGKGTAYGATVDEPVDVFDIYAPPPIVSALATTPQDPPQVLAARAERAAPLATLAVLNAVTPPPVDVPDPVDVFDAFAPPTPPALGYGPSVLDPDMLNPNIVSTPTDEMVGFGPVSRADIASVPGLESSVYPGFSLLGFNTGLGRGMFGGYTSTDAPTAQSDVDQGYATSEVGSFDPMGFFGGVAKGLASLAVPGLGLVANVAQQASLPSGMSDINALSNIVSSDRGLTEAEVLAAPTAAPPAVPAAAPAPPPAPDPFSVGFSDFGVQNPLVQLIEKQREEESTVKMSQGGSFLEQMLTGGLAATDKAQDILGKLPKPITALLGGAGMPTLTEKLTGKPATDTTAPPPPVRAMEAPVEAPPPPTAEELEEMQNIAVMQQVLSGVPVEAQAGGLISAYQMGGPPSPYFEGMVKGRGDGMSDSIPFTIEGTQPAILSRDEYVLPADIVSMMGNGSSDAGAEKIDTFINDFRVQKYGRGKQPPETRRGLSGVA